MVNAGSSALMIAMRLLDLPAGLSNCDRIMEDGIMLPCHPTMTDEDRQYVRQVLQDFINANRNA